LHEFGSSSCMVFCAEQLAKIQASCFGSTLKPPIVSIAWSAKYLLFSDLLVNFPSTSQHVNT